MNIHNASVWLDVLQKIFAVLGVLGTAIWGIKYRNWAMRLELSVNACVIEKNGMHFLHISCVAKNCGKLNIKVNRGETVAEIYVPSDPALLAYSEALAWEFEVITKVLQEQKEVKAGESVGDEQLIALPFRKAPFLRVDLTVTSSKTSWVCKSIIVNEKC